MHAVCWLPLSFSLRSLPPQEYMASQTVFYSFHTLCARTVHARARERRFVHCGYLCLAFWPPCERVMYVLVARSDCLVYFPFRVSMGDHHQAHLVGCYMREFHVNLLHGFRMRIEKYMLACVTQTTRVQFSFARERSEHL